MKTAVFRDAVQRQCKQAEGGSESHNVFTAMKVLKPETFFLLKTEHRGTHLFESKIVPTFLFFIP